MATIYKHRSISAIISKYSYFIFYFLRTLFRKHGWLLQQILKIGWCPFIFSSTTWVFPEDKHTGSDITQLSEIPRNAYVYLLISTDIFTLHLCIRKLMSSHQHEALSSRLWFLQTKWCWNQVCFSLDQDSLCEKFVYIIYMFHICCGSPEQCYVNSRIGPNSAN